MEFIHRMPNDLFHRVKNEAVRRGVSIESFINSAVCKELDSIETVAMQKKIAELQKSQKQHFSEAEKKPDDLIKWPPEIRLSIRARKAFNRLGVKTYSDLQQLTRMQLLKVRGVGVTTLREIDKKLKAIGITLKHE